ncbi:hypothetical protein INR49_000755 [Caranx melampygus]|nr:hypothetical protein INR49_000755 [Caranx melampygus]
MVMSPCHTATACAYTLSADQHSLSTQSHPCPLPWHPAPLSSLFFLSPPSTRTPSRVGLFLAWLQHRSFGSSIEA